MTEIEITEGDREAVEAWLDGLKVSHVNIDDDSGDLAYAFAQHRTQAREAAIEEAAGVADTVDMGRPWSTADSCSRFHARNAIATAIRALAPSRREVG